MRILHFADVHIDIASQRKRDPETGLPIRVLDFLKALDSIVDTAIQEKVDLVLFAGDAYKDRTPIPTYQREWGQRIMRLSQNKIPTLLLVGNHDMSPAKGRANSIQEFDTLKVPFVKVLAKPDLLTSKDLFNLPIQIIAIPWIFRSAKMASLISKGEETTNVFEEIEKDITTLVDQWWEKVNLDIPVILTAHTMVQGAVGDSENTISMGNELELPGAMVRDPRLAYSALGHIHKYQDLNYGNQPPVVYPGSIERVNFGEVKDDKGFVIVTIESGKPTRVDRRVIPGRRFIDKIVQLDTPEEVVSKLLAVMPSAEDMEGAIFRLRMDYPRSLQPLIDELGLMAATAGTLEFHLIHNPWKEARSRIPDNILSGKNPIEQLTYYWKTQKEDSREIEELNNMALSIFSSSNGMGNLQD